MEMVHDTIVIGSGIGGLACASALAKCGHRVIVLEQHYVPGGLTQTFTRKGFTWDVGIHYLGEMGPRGRAQKILDWLSDGAIKMAPIAGAYDIIHFPGNFEITFSSPAEVLKMNLKKKFPHSAGDIDAFFLLLMKMARISAVAMSFYFINRGIFTYWQLQWNLLWLEVIFRYRVKRFAHD